jgi:hypothetical protein
MGVLHAENSYSGNPTPVEAPVLLEWGRVAGRLEDEAVGVVEIKGDLPLPIPTKLMTPRLRKGSHHLQSVGGPQFVESPANQPCPHGPMASLEQLRLAELLFELPGREEDIQAEEQLLISFTEGVNVSVSFYLLPLASARQKTPWQQA